MHFTCRNSKLGIHLFRKIVGKKAIGVFFTVIFLLLPATLVAGGNPEVGLPKVDRLIKDRNYNEAILELATYMNENPDDFDGAQRRIKRIIEMRESYNAKALELLLVLANEPTNDEKKLNMIAYLESLEKNPNSATRDFILGTKAAAQFTFYRAKFDEIMTEGDAFIDQGLYVEAARKFTEGYIFYKQEFDEETETVLLSQVNTALGEIVSSIGTFADLQVSFTAAVAEVERALAAGDIFASEAAFTVLEAETARFGRMRNVVAASGILFTGTFSAIQAKDNLVTENSFLPFAYRFTLGRKTAGRFEGVLGAMDTQWNNMLDRLDAAALKTVRETWLAGAALLESGNAAGAVDTLDSTGRFAALGRKISSTAAVLTAGPEIFGNREFTQKTALYALLEDVAASFVTLAGTYGTYLELGSRTVRFIPAEALPDTIRKAPSAAVTAYAAFAAEFTGLSVAVENLRSSDSQDPVLIPFLQEYEAFRQKLLASLSTDRLAVVRRSAGYQETAVSVMLAEWQASWTAANSLLEGAVPPGGTIPVFYPAESIIAFNRLRSGILADSRSIASAVGVLGRLPPGDLADAETASSIRKMEEAAAALDALYSGAASAIARANSRILQANLARQESDLRYTQAQAALKRLDFQAARDNLQRARDKVNQSLALQESAALRTDSDARIEKLGIEITRVENESVVREVRALITTGKNFYYLGNFDQAEQVFIQAKTRWGVTNVEANPEITNWLDIINTALSMKTGRTIPVAAPLFPQMSQILSSVNQLFIEGKSLMSSGQRTAGIGMLNIAKEKLQQLQLVYPLNQDAGELTLRINQLIDPAAFTEFFRQKVATVRATYKTDKQTAYSDLLDLYRINPEYPGLKRLVDEVEIYLGIQIPPPDPKAIARSAELTRAAQKIYDANTRSQFQVALSQLDEAIKLNPDNQTAIALKDRVQTSSGGQSVAVLSAGDEAKYQQAVQELQKGNKITASALVEQLLQNPKSRNSAKIQDLKKRIDSQL